MADLNALLSAEFGSGYQDLRATLPHNPNGPSGDFSLRPLLGLDILAVHHTVGPRDQSWKAIAQTHIKDRGFAGIGYHIGIRQGAVAYLGDVSQARACCRDMNHRVLCVSITGNYETMPLDAADAKALGRVAAVVQGWAQSSIGRKLKVLGHKEVPGQATACPGRNLLVEVHRIATLPDPGTPTGPDAPRLLGVQKLAPEGITLRVLVRTRPGEQDAVERELNRRVKLRFDREGLELAQRWPRALPGGGE